MGFLTHTIDDFDTKFSEYWTLWDLSGKPITSFRKNYFIIFSACLCFLEESSKTFTNSSILINAEKYTINRAESTDHTTTISFILKTWYSSLKFCLSIIIDYNPELICSGKRFREFKGIDMPWMNRVCIDGSDGEFCHRILKSIRKNRKRKPR